MADDIFVSNDIELDVDFGEIFVIDQGIVTKVVAKKYDPTRTYIVGEYVIYSANLYRCTTAIDEPEEFDSEKWTKVLLADEVQTINTALPLKADKSDTYTKQEVDTALGGKADKTDTYTKSEVNTALADKADKSDTYTKSEVNTALSAKANTTDVDTALTLKADKTDTYTKTAVDNALALKADQATTYTKSEVDTALSTKANSSDVYNKTEVYTKDQVDNIINNLPAPMIFKGTLGTDGTITTLPTASSDNEGYTYKVITDGTYASQAAKAGDMFTSNGSEWVYIPSGDETFIDTWRGVKVNGTEQLTSSIASGDVDFVNGTNSTVVFNATGNTIAINVDGYTQAQIDTKLDLKADASTTYSKTEVDTALSDKANTSDVNTALDGKADKSTTYTKTEVDTALSGKANASTTYTKSEVDTALSSKANSSDVYTKTQTDAALANKANTSGEYNGLISGQTNALKPSARLENSTPYLYRPSFSNGYGYETLIGGTCGVNQLVNTGDTSVNTISGHKYLTRINHVESIIVGGSAVSINDSSEDNVIDLTAMFGPTIADYVYTLESGTAGAGITWLKNNGFDFSKYAPYNAGGLLSVKTSKKVNRGFNAFDELWESGTINQTTGAEEPNAYIDRFENYIPIVPNTRYYFNYTANNDIRIFYYDANKNYIGTIIAYANNSFVSPANACYIRGTHSNADGHPPVCINISCDLDGQYQPYVSHEYPLDGSRKVHRVFGIVDLGSVNWSRATSSGTVNYFYIQGGELPSLNIKEESYPTSLNLVCPIYITKSNNNSIASALNTDMTMCRNQTNICIRNDTYSTPEQFTTAMNGVYLVYELATPFDETVSNPELRGILKLDSNNKLYYYGDTCNDFTNPMVVDGNGTEEFVDTRAVQMPVGHSTIYVDDNDATKLDNLPDISNDGNGTYLVNQVNGQMSLDKYPIPNPPTTDGSYRLEVTVTDGVPAYSWEEITE